MYDAVAMGDVAIGDAVANGGTVVVGNDAVAMGDNVAIGDAVSNCDTCRKMMPLPWLQWENRNTILTRALTSAEAE